MGRRPGSDGIKPGGLNDPVAQSIRAEQNRDAAPSASEVKAEHRRALSKQGCEVCGEDDASKLTSVRVGHTFCGNDQPPRKPFESKVFCDEHERPGPVLARARLVQWARNKGADVIAKYACGAATLASWDRPSDAELAQRMGPDPTDFDDLRLRGKVRFASVPEVPAIHVGRGRCGAELTDIIQIDQP